MGKVEPRNVSPILSALRNFLLGRSFKSPMRFGDLYAPRTQPPPNIPGGSADKLADNYYYARDGRRETAPPFVLAIGGSQKLLQEQQRAKDEKKTSNADITSRTPGSVYNWD